MKTLLRVFAGLYFVCMAAAVTFPGVRPFNSIRPFILGLPFSFAWVVGWVLGAGVVFFLVYLAEHRR